MPLAQRQEKQKETGASSPQSWVRVAGHCGGGAVEGRGARGSRKVRPWWRRRRGVASIGKKVDGERDSLIYIDPAKTDTQLGYMYM